MQKILTEYGTRQEIAKIFGVSGMAVTLALQGLRNSDLSKKIRHVALTQFGAVEMKPVKTNKN